MAPPSTIVDLRTELLLGSLGWTDISTNVFNNTDVQGITITRGQPDESPLTQATRLVMRLQNDGRFSSRNPLGAYYGSIGRNTQVRVSVPEGASYLRLESDTTSGASAPDAVGLDITGDTEIQIDVTLDNWASSQALASKWTASTNNRSWWLGLNEDSTLSFSWSNDGTTIHTATSSAAVPIPALRRQAVKVTLATASGTVTFYTASSISSSYTQLGTAQVLGAAAVFNSSASVILGHATSTDFSGYTGNYGKVHAFKLLSGIGGTVKASPDFTTQTPGASSFADAQSNTWTLSGTAEISNRNYRAHCEVAAWPQGWDPTGTYVWVDVTANGLLRRLGQSSKPLRSAMYRYWTKAPNTAPVAYWSLEDGSKAAGFSSPMAGVSPMQILQGFVGGVPTFGQPSFASDSSFACSGALPTLNTNNPVWRGLVPDYTSGSGFEVVALLKVPSGETSSSAMLTFKASGDIGWGYLTYTTGSGGTLTFNLYSPDAVGESSVPPTYTGCNGQTLLVGLAVDTPSAGNVTYRLRVAKVGDTSVTTSADTTIVGGISKLGKVTQVIVNDYIDFLNTQAAQKAVIGHIAVQASSAAGAFSDAFSALAAYNGENAGLRMSRLCTEEGLAFRGQGRLDTTVPMGTQLQATLLSLIQDAANADMGLLFEPRQQLALGYRTRQSLYSQSAAVALDYSQAHLSGQLQPTDDDQFSVNDVTISRVNGSSARQVLTSGAMSTAAPPSGIGTYDTQVTVNVQADSQLNDIAGWQLHLGTVNEPRYPLMQFSLGRTALASLLDSIQRIDLGDRYTVANTPVWLPPDGISQLMHQMTERLGGYIFEQDWTGVPESPYEVGVVNDGSYGYVDTDGSTLHAGINSSATLMGVDPASSSQPLWTLDIITDMPFDIAMGGERITVRDIDGPPANFLTGANTNFDGPATGNWTNVTNCSRAADGTVHYAGNGSLQITSSAAGDMTAAHCQAANIATQGLVCVPGDLINLACLFIAATAGRVCSVGAQFYTSGGVSISTLFAATTISDVTTGWKKLSGTGWPAVPLTVTAPATAAFCRMVVKIAATGAANEIHNIEDAYMANMTGGGNQQTFVVVRSVNGVVKSHSSGEDVRLFNPSIVAL